MFDYSFDPDIFAFMDFDFDPDIFIFTTENKAQEMSKATATETVKNAKTQVQLKNDEKPQKTEKSAGGKMSEIRSNGWNVTPKGIRYRVTPFDTGWLVEIEGEEPVWWNEFPTEEDVELFATAEVVATFPPNQNDKSESSNSSNSGAEIVLLEKFSPRPFVLELTKRFQLFSAVKPGSKDYTLYAYDSSTGIWIEEADPYIESYLRKQLMGMEKAKKYYVSEVIADLKAYIFDPQKPHFPEPPLNFIPFANGVYDIETDQFFNYQPEHFFTNKLPVPYIPDITCPTIERVFAEWVEDPTDLYELVAYCLLRDYPYQKFFLLYGSGANGKSVFLQLLKELLGSQNVCSISLPTLVSDKFATAELYQKYAAISCDTPYTILQKTDILKQLTGGDLIRAERKYRSPFQFKNFAKIIIATNEIPVTDDKSDAFYRRVFFIHFPNKFTDRENPLLLQTLVAELPGLACKAIVYLKRLKERAYRFTNHQTVEDVQKKYENLTNPFALFIKEFCEEDAAGIIPKWIFREVFNAWLKANGYRAWTDQHIGAEASRFGFETVRKVFSAEAASNYTRQVYELLSAKGIHVDSIVKPVHSKVSWWCYASVKLKGIDNPANTTSSEVF